MGKDLPAEPLNVVKEDPKKENIIYVGSDNGLYASLNKGISFMTMGNNLPRVPVHDIAIQKTANEIVLGTHGRSIYIASLDSVHKAYNAFINRSNAKDNGTALQLFDWKKMNAGELDIDCPPAQPKRKTKKVGSMIVVD